MRRHFFTILFSTVVLAANLMAQFNMPEVVKLETYLSVDKVAPGSEFRIAFNTKIDPEWHINSNKPSEDFLIPTEIKFNDSEQFEVSRINYPEGELIKFEFSEEPLSVYETEIVIQATVRANKALSPGAAHLAGMLTYQACNDVSCLAPTKIPFDIAVNVVSAGAAVNQINQPKFGTVATELGALQGERSLPENKITQLMAGSGLMITLAFIFIGGLALNLTPCVYPIIPITISYFVSQASGKLVKSFFLALIYVLGLSLTYSILGVVAAMTGGLLGSSLQNPLVLVFIAAIFLVFAASMFGAFEIRVPAALSNLAGGSRKGVFGTFFMGLTVGIVAAPCIGPFVISLLTYVAVQGDPMLGFTMFFVLSMGLGLPYLILGTFSGLIKTLPRSGDWMVWVKKVFGVIMIGVAIYFVSSLISEVLYIGLITALAVAGGIFVGFVDKSAAQINWFRGLKSTIGIVMILFGVWTSVSAWQETRSEHIDWQPYDDALIAEAKSAGKPVLIDFYADWCIPCKQIDKTLFSAPAVVAKSAEFVALKADLTKDTSEHVQSIRKKYQVLGVPTVILIDSRGNEYKRFTDELVGFKVEEFLEEMQGAM
ncbi:MAG: protein-disulfide reductase DsbD [bacterium]